MSQALPLAAAAQRLRGRPGRPPLNAEERSRRAEERKARQAAALAAVNPRLYNVPHAAKYLGVSVWTVRDLHAAGNLACVRLPLVGDKELNRLLFDVRELDRLIEQSRQAVEP